MPQPPLPRDVLDLLSKPTPAVIATLRPDGQPVSVATWYVLDGDALLYFGMGIHGQNLFVDPVNELVIAKFSSQAAKRVPVRSRTPRCIRPWRWTEHRQ